jgi:hypothetical protein
LTAGVGNARQDEESANDQKWDAIPYCPRSLKPNSAANFDSLLLHTP